MVSSDPDPTLRVIVPGDPEQNTGGYRYVRKLVEALEQLGTCTETLGLDGRFPRPDALARRAMDVALGRCPDGAVAILDGLAMGAMPDILEQHAHRLRLLALVHHPLADETGLDESDRHWFFQQECRALAVVSQVLTTSAFTAGRLAAFGVPPERIHTALPGVAVHLAGAAVQERPRAAPLELLCVGHPAPRKAQHHLVEALQALQALPWHCTLVGSLDRDPVYSQQMVAQIQQAGLNGRVTLTGEVGDGQLADLYGRSDLFVFPSLYEGYGMVIDEARSAGLPVISSDGGALADTAVGVGVRQFPAGDVGALTDALRAWLADPAELAAQTDLVRSHRPRAGSWEQAARVVLKAARRAETGAGTLFNDDWLALRESADHRARSATLTRTLNTWLTQDWTQPEAPNPEQAVGVVDLGTGRGSNALFLAPRLQVPQHWCLIDQDARLLSVARDRLQQSGTECEAIEARLTSQSLAECIPPRTRLVTASALIDLVSQDWLEALATAVADRGAAVLIVLSYTGYFRLAPARPDDDRLRELVNQHQKGDKGTGQALGPQAPEALASRMASTGYAVSVAESTWRLDARDGELMSQLMEGWVSAAGEIAPDEQGWLSDWLSDRKAQLAAGTLSVEVGHRDVLALPPDQGA